jgi:ATP-dependent Lhr-like helicase
VTNDAWAPLRAPKQTLAKAKPKTNRPGRRFGTRRTGSAATPTQGRWALSGTIFRREPEPGARRRVLAELLLERYGIVTREQGARRGDHRRVLDPLRRAAAARDARVCRRGYFVEGLGGAQFALPGAVERLRAQQVAEETPPVVLAATDPAQPYGAALPWPKRDGEKRRPARVRGAYVVLAGAEPVVYVEKGGRGLVLLVEPGDPRLRGALEALVAFISGGRGRKLALEKLDGESIIGHELEELLVELGFRQGPTKLTLSA